MSDPYFQTRFADRIGGPNYGKGTEIYKFEKIKRAKRKALADFPNRSLVDFGIGENDSMAPESIRRKLNEEANLPQNRGYMRHFIELPADRGVDVWMAMAVNVAPQAAHTIEIGPAFQIVKRASLGPCDEKRLVLRHLSEGVPNQFAVPRFELLAAETV